MSAPLVLGLARLFCSSPRCRPAYDNRLTEHEVIGLGSAVRTRCLHCGTEGPAWPAAGLVDRWLGSYTEAAA